MIKSLMQVVILLLVFGLNLSLNALVLAVEKPAEVIAKEELAGKSELIYEKFTKAIADQRKNYELYIDYDFPVVTFTDKGGYKPDEVMKVSVQIKESKTNQISNNFSGNLSLKPFVYGKGFKFGDIPKQISITNGKAYFEIATTMISDVPEDQMGGLEIVMTNEKAFGTVLTFSFAVSFNDPIKFIDRLEPALNQEAQSPSTEINDNSQKDCRDEKTVKIINDDSEVVFTQNEADKYIEIVKATQKDSDIQKILQLFKQGYFFEYIISEDGYNNQGHEDYYGSLLKIFDHRGELVDAPLASKVLEGGFKNIDIIKTGTGIYDVKIYFDKNSDINSAPPINILSVFIDGKSSIPYFSGDAIGDTINVDSLKQKLDEYESGFIAVENAKKIGKIEKIETRCESYSLFTAPPFIKQIATPETISTDIKVIGANLLLTIPFLLLFGFASSLFNSTLKQRRNVIYATIGNFPIIGNLLTMDEDKKIAFFKKNPKIKLGFVALAIIFYGFIASFLSQQEKLFTTDHWQFMMITIVATAVLGLFPELVKMPFLKKFGVENALTMYPIGIFFALICVAISFFLHINPAILFGVPVVMLLAHSAFGKNKDKAFIAEATAGVATLVLAVIFWGVSPFFKENVSIYTFLLTAFLMIIEGLFFELMPIEPLAGGNLWSRSKLLWLSVATPIGFIFFHTINSPNSTLDQFMKSENLQTTFSVLLAYSIFAIVFWFIWGRTINKKSIHEQA